MELAGWGLLGLFGLALVLLIAQRLRGKPVPLVLILVLGVFTLGMGTVVNFVNSGEDYTAWKRLQWQEFTPQEIPALVAQGKTVVVDITAAWCSICTKNKAEVLHRQAVVEALEADNIVLMQAEMSEPHPVAEAYLTQQQAFGVPYNKIYSPAHPEGLDLPRELNYELFMAALSAANP